MKNGFRFLVIQQRPTQVLPRPLRVRRQRTVGQRKLLHPLKSRRRKTTGLNKFVGVTAIIEAAVEVVAGFEENSVVGEEVGLAAALERVVVVVVQEAAVAEGQERLEAIEARSALAEVEKRWT